MTLVLSLKNISKTYGDDTLFKNLSVDFNSDERLGLIGMNGSGKSTLLRLIAGETAPDDGEIISKPGVKFVCLPQEDNFPLDKSVEQILYTSIKSTGADEKEQHRIVQKAMGRAGFEDPGIPAHTLSGGWKKKLAIVTALCRLPDMLLLDEPTNHMDIKGILWLEDLLKTADFSYIIVSHDRAFLESVCQNVMEIAPYYPAGHFRVNGGYRLFEKERIKLLSAQEKQQASLTSRMRREDAWLAQGPKARTTKAKYRIDNAQRLRRELDRVRQRNQETAAIDVAFESTGRKTKKLLRACHLTHSVAGRKLFAGLNFELGPGFCLGVVGENGSGKSTFLSLLEKKAAPDSGKIQWAPDLKIAVFDQHRSDLNPEDTLKAALNPAGGDSIVFGGRSIHIVTWAKRFLFMPDQLDMPVSRLSGGEKARIILANLMRSPSDILFLDEPTNDLDILSLQVLEDSLLQFKGAVVIVSHDRFLMDRICHKILYLAPDIDGKFFQDFSQILNFRRTQTQKPSKPEKKAAPKPRQKTVFSYKDKYELEHIEENILEAEAAVEHFTELIQQPDILKDPDKMRESCAVLKQAQEKVARLYDRWEILEAKKEAAS